MTAPQLTVSASFTEDDHGFYVHFRAGSAPPVIHGPIPDASTARAVAGDLVKNAAAEIRREMAAITERPAP